MPGGYPLIVVLPDGGTSRYLNLPWHERFGLRRDEDLMVQDINVNTDTRALKLPMHLEFTMISANLGSASA